MNSWTKEQRAEYMKEYNKRYYAKNLDKEKSRVRNNRIRFKDKIVARNKMWAKRNPKKIRRWNHEQYLKRRSDRLAYQKQYYQSHKDNYRGLYRQSVEKLGDWYVNGLIRKLKVKHEKGFVKSRVVMARKKKVNRLLGKKKAEAPYVFNNYFRD